MAKLAPKKAVDLPSVAKSEPVVPAKPKHALRTATVTIEVPLLPAGEDDYLSHHVNIRLLTMEQRRTFRALINGLDAKYPTPPGTSSKRTAAAAIQYLLDQISAQASLVS